MTKKNPAARSRVTYPQELRAKAKASQLGLVTIQITFPNGTKTEHQATIDVLQAQFAKWAMALLFAEHGDLPDVEGLIRKAMNNEQTDES